jgi:hypothetical protein
MKYLTFVGGISAAGKTSTVQRLGKLANVQTIRFHQVLKQEFNARKIPLEETLNRWKAIVPEIAFKYVQMLPDGNTMCDVHYAVQPCYDLSLSLRNPIVPEPLHELYTSGIDISLLAAIKKKGNIKVELVLLTAPIEEIIYRRGIRKSAGIPIRSLSLESIKLEQKAEEKFYRQTALYLDLPTENCILIDNSEINFDKNFLHLSERLKTNGVK